MERIWQQSYRTLAPANHVIMQYHRGDPQLTATFALKPNLRPLFWMFWGGLRSWGRFLILCMVSKGNLNEWLVHGMTTLQVSHRNGSTTPPSATYQILHRWATWIMAFVQETHVHTTAEVFLILYMVSKGNSNEWCVHGRTTLQASHHNSSTTPPSATCQNLHRWAA